jgi:hypothetical protein
MLCSECSEKLSLYVDGLLDGQEVELLKLHMDGCVICRMEWEAMAKVDSLLASAPSLKPNPGLSARVALRLHRREVQRQRMRYGAAMLLGSLGAWSLTSVVLAVSVVPHLRPLLRLFWGDVAQPVLGTAVLIITTLSRASFSLATELLTSRTWLVVPAYVLIAVTLVAAWARVVFWRRSGLVGARPRAVSQGGL